MSIQGSINQLLGATAIATNYATKQAAENYAQKRAAEFEASYQANVEAAQKGYTKSGAKSKSKAAQEAQAKVAATQPGEGSKAPWNRKAEEQLGEIYTQKMKGLQDRTQAGVKKLKETKAKSEQDMYKQFGEYQELAPQIIGKLPAEDRWKLQAEAKLKQQQAFDNFLETIKGGKK